MFTNMKRLMNSHSKQFGIVAKFKGKIMVVDRNSNGNFIAEVYNQIETPAETGLLDSECRLELYAKAKTTFEDSGQAVSWCLEQMG